MIRRMILGVLIAFSPIILVWVMIYLMMFISIIDG
jgi:hypothetical protein